MRVTDADSFIHEVSEEVRRDRMFRLWKRYGPFAIAALVAVVAATAALEWRKHLAAEAARDAGGTMIAADRETDPARRAGAFATAVDALDGGAAAVARLREAAALAASGDDEAARAAYAALAADPALDPTLAAFAAFRAASLLAAADTLGAIDALTPIARGDGPFRLLALEALAAARLKAGDAEGARAEIAAASGDPTATDLLRRRLAEFGAALDAAAGAAPEALAPAAAD
jgi:hypothetical protein